MTELEVKTAVRARDGNRCVDCSMSQEMHWQLFDRDLHVHRLEPGSVYTVEGCVTVCFDCHTKRHGKTPDTNHVHGKVRSEVEIVDFSFRCDIDFLARLKAAAKQKNISVAAYLRLLASERMDADAVPQPKLPPRK